MYTVYRCEICEEAYLTAGSPSRCPFCGAHSKHMVEQGDWKDPERPQLSDESRKNLEQTLGFEISNASFYMCAAKKARAAGNSWQYAMWKRLSKVELEHAEVAVKLLGIEQPELDTSPDLCSGDFAADIKAATARETNAMKHYARFAAEAEEPRVKQVFLALVEIEDDHLKLEERLQANL